MKLVFHGAAREVGRSCIEIQARSGNYLLDCGVKFTHDGFAYPDKLFASSKRVDAIFLSHAHLDHSGGLPLIEHYGLTSPIFCTHQTLAITRLLLRDSFKIARIKHLHPAFDKTDLREVRKDARRVQPDKLYKYEDVLFRFLNAGHIPGSSSVLLDLDGVRLLYTGDFNTRTTRLMRPADFQAIADSYGPIDVLITESTYGARKLPQRPALERDLLDSIQRVIRRGGTVLIPVFAVGRAQEILILLSRRQWSCPIYFDGMAKEVTRKILLHQSSYVMNKDLLNEMYMRRVTLVSSQQRRMLAAKTQPAIIVTTSGMLQGGPAMSYLKQLWHDSKNAVFLTGYQVPGTNGYRLLTKGSVYIDGWKTYVKCPVRKFDFSGHADTDDIKQAILTIKPRHLIVQHGEPESVDHLVAWAREQGLNATGPAFGDTIRIP